MAEVKVADREVEGTGKSILMVYCREAKEFHSEANCRAVYCTEVDRRLEERGKAPRIWCRLKKESE